MAAHPVRNAVTLVSPSSARVNLESSRRALGLPATPGKGASVAVELRSHLRYVSVVIIPLLALSMLAGCVSVAQGRFKVLDVAHASLFFYFTFFWR